MEDQQIVNFVNQLANTVEWTTKNIPYNDETLTIEKYYDMLVNNNNSMEYTERELQMLKIQNKTAVDLIVDSVCEKLEQILKIYFIKFNRDLELAKQVYEIIKEGIMTNELYRERITYAVLPSFEYLLDSRRYLGDKRILGIASGSGYIEYWMKVVGLEVHCTDDKSWKKLTSLEFTEVENITSSAALAKYRKQFNVIFVSWLINNDHFNQKDTDDGIMFDNDPGADIVDYLWNNKDVSLYMIYETIQNITGTTYFWQTMKQLNHLKEYTISTDKYAYPHIMDRNGCQCDECRKSDKMLIENSLSYYTQQV